MLKLNSLSADQYLRTISNICHLKGREKRLMCKSHEYYYKDLVSLRGIVIRGKNQLAKNVMIENVFLLL